MEIDIEGDILKLGLKRSEDNLLRKGIINKRFLPLDKLEGGRLLQKVYNSSFHDFKLKSRNIEGDSFSDIIDTLFLSKREVIRRKELTTHLGYGYEDKRLERGGYCLVDKETQIEVPLTRCESIIMNYDTSKNLHNYLITIVSNQLRNFKKYTISKNYENTPLEDCVVEEGDSQNLESHIGYSQLSLEVCNRARELFKTDYSVSLNQEWFTTILKFVGDLDFTIKEVEILLEDNVNLVRTIWGHLEEAFIEVAEGDSLDMGIEELSKYLQNGTQGRIGSKGCRKSAKLIDKLELEEQTKNFEGGEYIEELRKSYRSIAKILS